MDPVSKETDEGENKDFQKKIDKLECPFTWLMDDIDNHVTLSTDYKPHDDEEFIPLLKLMRILMTIYVQSKQNENSEIILENLRKCDEILLELKAQANLFISTEAIMHVLNATQCHVYWNLDQTDDATTAYKNITWIKSTDKIGQSTLNACRAIGWSKYHRVGSEEAVNFIRKALTDNPDCDLWYFILGKNLRRIRRDSSIGSIPEDEEANAFLKAYEKSKNSVYGVFVAQMYREQRLNSKALKMYEEIYRGNPKCQVIYLRLALGFLQLRSNNLAKACLDKVATECPDDNMYLHYRGKFYMKTKNFSQAILYLKKAADDYNYPAARDYIRCMLRLNALFDPTEYLLSLIELYKILPEKQIQGLLLDTAFSYLRKRKIENSLEYFLHGIEIDPDSQAITEFYSLFEASEAQNVYKRLARQVFPLVNKKSESLSESALETYDKLKIYYDEYLEKELENTVTALLRVTTGKIN